MGTIAAEKQKKPHAVCIPFPAQGHLNPMMKVAKLLHLKGFHITFVNNHHNHRRLLKSRGANALDGLPDFQFRSIPDGLPPTDDLDSTQDVPSLCYYTPRHCLAPFRSLVVDELNASTPSSPPVTCIVSDGIMSFTADVAEELGIPVVLFWTLSGCGFSAYAHYKELMERGITPLKDSSYLTNGFLDNPIHWIPGMEGMPLKYLPNFIFTTDPNDVVVNFALREVQRSITKKPAAILLNTFDDLEQDVLGHLSTIFPPIYTIGPLCALTNHFPGTKQEPLASIGSNLWKDEPECLQWLDAKAPRSVVFVNFGSVTVMSPHHLVEFAWGLANTKLPFLWIIRPDIVRGETSILPAEFVEETAGRGVMAGWCPQEEVLKHPAVGGFLSHMGWNSVMESLCGGVPMVCWPFFADQQINTWFACERWGVGMEIGNDVKREQVEVMVRELIVGEKGEEMRKKAAEWKAKAEEAVEPGRGLSYLNFDNFVNDALLAKKS